MKPVADILAASEIFEGTPKPALEALAAQAGMARFAPGQAIFEAGDDSDALYAVISGRIRVYRTSEDGEEVTLALIDPENLLGEIGAIDGAGRTASASAVGKTELARISTAVFQRFLEENPTVAMHVLKVVCARMRNTISQLDSLAFLGLEARLARLLVMLCRSHGVPQPDGAVLIDLRLGQRELGAFIALSRESVSKQMALWRAEGLIDKRDGRMAVCDPETLEALAQLPPEAEG